MSYSGTAMTNGKDTSALILESHEERLQTVETSLKDCMTEVAKSSTKLDEVGNKFETMGEQFRMAGEHVADKIDTLISNLNDKLDAHGETLKSVVTQVTDNTKQIDVLNRTESERGKRKATLQKLTVSLVTLAMGGLVTKGVTMLMAHFGM